MKKFEAVCKILSAFLASILVVQVLPLQVAAENVTDAIAEKDFLEYALENPVTENNTNNEYILYEVEEKRDEYTKVYKKSDGSFTAVMTETPLHYFNDGVWEEINNTMKLAGDFYTNTDNLFNVLLPKNIDSNESLTVENDGYELSFNVEGISQSPAVVENNIVAGDADIDVAQNAIAQTQSSVTYSNVAENTDLQYIVTPNSIKENIIVSDKESVKDTYTFTFQSNGLQAEKLENGSIIFKNEQGEMKFTIPRPVMTDANLEYSYDIDVVLIENSDGTHSLEYAPSKEWLNSSARTYPVAIDPAISVENDKKTWVEDTFVVASETDSSAQNTNYYDAYLGIIANTTDDDNGEIYTEIYTRFNMEAFKDLGSNIVFTEAQYLSFGALYNCTLLAKKIETPVDLTTVTWASKPYLDDEVIDYYTSPFSTIEEGEPAYIHFNLTKALNEWYNGDEDNNGFAIVPGSEDFWGALYLNGTRKTTNSSGTVTETYTTTLALDYIDMGGYNEKFNYHTWSADKAGAGYVNDFTQQFSVIRDDISSGDSGMPISISMLYNSANYNKCKALRINTALAYGNNWVPNILRAFLVVDENQFTYYSDTGTTIDYIRFVDETGNIAFKEAYSEMYGVHGYKPEYRAATDAEAEQIVMVRPDGYEEHFNSLGLLICVNSPNTPSESVTITYDTLFRIDYVTDYSGKKFDFIYDNTKNLLEKIECRTAENTHLDSYDVTYSYDNSKNLIEVQFTDGGTVKYTYDENGKITSMTHENNCRIEYGFSPAGKVISVTKKKYENGTYTAGNVSTFTRLSPTQIKYTDGDGKAEIYQFNRNGEHLYTIDSEGNCTINKKNETEGDMDLFSGTGFSTNTKNLLRNPSFEKEENVLNKSNAKYWENTNSKFKRTTLANASYMCTDSETNNITGILKQTVDVLSGGKYTFSAVIKSSKDNSGKLTLKISSYNALNTVTKEKSILIENTNEIWLRYFVTLEAPSDSKKISVEFISADINGEFFIDNVQLEQSASASGYNYIENSGFKSEFEDWNTETSCSITDIDVNGLNGKAVEISANTDAETTISQTVEIAGKKNDVVSVGGWFKGHFTKSSTNNAWLLNEINELDNPNVCNFTKDRYAQIEVTYQYTEYETGELLTEKIAVPFEENISEWQFAKKDFTLKGDCSEMIVVIRCAKNQNPVCLTNIELTNNNSEYTLQYNGNGQLESLYLGSQAILSYSYNNDKIGEVIFTDDIGQEISTQFLYTDNRLTQINENGKPKYTLSNVNGLFTSVLSADNRLVRYVDDDTFFSDLNNNSFEYVENGESNYFQTTDENGYTTKIYDVNYNIVDGPSVEKNEIIAHGGNAIDITSEQDKFGRRSNIAVTIKENCGASSENSLASLNYIYDYGAVPAYETLNQEKDYKILNQVETYTNEIKVGNDLLENYSVSYEYDINGNITKEYEKSFEEPSNERYSYAYDEQNRLVRFNDNVSEPKRSYSYEYDEDGVLLSKSTYVYTPIEDDLDQPLLTKYYNVSDNTSFNGGILSWEGNLLSTCTVTEKDENNNDITKQISYSYNEDGLLSSKTVSEKPKEASDESYQDIERYDYTWAYGKLMNQVYTNYETTEPTIYTIRFVYDSFNSPQGFIVNHSEIYLYLKNLQGDIVGVVDEHGDIVLTYSYDVWGAFNYTIEKNDDYLNALKAILPLAYRGYCYDYDTGLYYVEESFYNPETGRFINFDSAEDNGFSEISAKEKFYIYWNNHPAVYGNYNENKIYRANSIANYLHNKNISGSVCSLADGKHDYIYNQKADCIKDYRYGFRKTGNIGCGWVATYNAAKSLNLPLNPEDIIREYEMKGTFVYGCWGTHPVAIAQFFIKRGYEVKITFDNSSNTDNEIVDNFENTARKYSANIMYYLSSSNNHYVAMNCEGDDFIAYNAFCTASDVENLGDSITNITNGKKYYEGNLLISISPKAQTENKSSENNANLQQ